MSLGSRIIYMLFSVVNEMVVVLIKLLVLYLFRLFLVRTPLIIMWLFVV